MLTKPLVDQNAVGWRFDNTYSRLPNLLFVSARPAIVREPKVSILNFRLATELGLDLGGLSSEAAANLFAGQVLPDGSQPIAQAYAGHQYGHFTMLGDGRAILLGEHRTPSNQLVDIQFKGSGRTAFSRGGDGRAALGPMLREYLISEAMWALGIPTTRSLAVVTTGEPVYRTSPLRGAILTRVAASHIRVGTFEYASARQDAEVLRVLADYTIARHYPELVDVDQSLSEAAGQQQSLQAPDVYGQFLRAVMDRQASLIAQWQMVGFIHGVMNTDNMAISGQTIDYGPCAFMNVYRPDTVFSSIDRNGRYAYGNQPAISQWNLARFAEALLPLLNVDQDQAVTIAMDVLDKYPALYHSYWLAGMRKKLGLRTDEIEDVQLIQSLLDWMQTSQADFTNTFRDLSEGLPLDGGDNVDDVQMKNLPTSTDGGQERSHPVPQRRNEEAPTDERYRDPDFRTWHSRWRQRLSREGEPMGKVYTRMQSVNPAVIPRNHRVEEALFAAEQHDDLSIFHRLLAALSSPYEAGLDSTYFREPSPDDDRYQTFCGT